MKYDFEMRDLSDPGIREAISDSLGGRSDVIWHWSRLFDDVRSGTVDTWDVQWCYTAWKERWQSLLPRYNLVSNIGFGVDATHTTDPSTRLSRLRLEVPDIDLRSIEVEARRAGIGDRWVDFSVHRTHQSFLKYSAKALRSKLSGF